MRGPSGGSSQRPAEAGGSLTWETPARAGAAPTTTERVGTARRPGSGKRDGTAYECRNQWSNPLKSRTGSNLVDVGRPAARTRVLVARGTPKPVNRAGGEAVGKSAAHPRRCCRGKAGRHTRRTVSSERGNHPGSPLPPASQVGDGQARRQPTGPGWGGVPGVVRAWESHVHGEGGQRVRRRGTGMPGGRR